MVIVAAISGFLFGSALWIAVILLDDLATPSKEERDDR